MQKNCKNFQFFNIFIESYIGRRNFKNSYEYYKGRKERNDKDFR